MRYFRNGECIALAPHCDIYVYTPTRPPAIIFWIFIGFACSYFYGLLYLWVVAQKKHPAVLLLKKNRRSQTEREINLKKYFYAITSCLITDFLLCSFHIYNSRPRQFSAPHSQYITLPGTLPTS